MEKQFKYNNDDSEPLDRELYLYPIIRVGVIFGIAATTLFGMDCYQYLKSTHQSTPQETLSNDREQKTIDKLVK